MIAKYMKDLTESKSASVIRKMFEEGAALKKKFGEENVYDFSLGNPDLDPPEDVLNAIEIVSKDKSHMCHGYMPNAGYQFVREEMAKKTSIEQGVPISFENVVMAVGAAGALNVVLKSLLNPQDEVIVLCPYFAEYDHYIHNHNGVVVRVKTNEDFSINYDNIAQVLSPKTAAIIINSPNNPTGKIYSQEEIHKLAELLKQSEKKINRLPYIICDEPYRAITYNGKTVASIFNEYKNSVILTSFAKNLRIPGERLGYLCVNPSCSESKELIASCILATRILGYVNAPAFFQKVIAKSWQCKCDYSLYEKRCNEITEIMDYAGLNYIKPEGAFYLFVKVPEKWNNDDMAFTDHMKKFNILCAPGTGFGCKGWFRISYCVAEQTILNSKEAFYKAVHE